MAAPFTGVRVVETTTDRINELYKTKKITIGKKDYPNSFIVFKSAQQSAITRVDETGEVANLISDKLKAAGVKPKNKEQFMAMDALLDENIKVITLTGMAGSGKSILALAAAIELFEAEKYSRIILTRPMDSMGQMKDIGAVPGEVANKFGIYLHNFIDNASVIFSKKKEKQQTLESFTNVAEQYNMEFIPMQVMRGASFSNAIIIADEIQTLTQKQMLALGTRTGENSKLMLLGDLSQRDSNIKKAATGLHKFANSEVVKSSALTCHLELIKCERSAVSSLFATVLGEDNE